MYDSHIGSGRFGYFMRIIRDIMNDDDTKTDIDDLAEQVQQAYEDGKLQATQYDYLMDYVAEIESIQ